MDGMGMDQGNKTFLSLVINLENALTVCNFRIYRYIHQTIPRFFSHLIDKFKVEISQSCFLGFMLTFYSGVFGTSIHSTKQFGEERNYLLGLSGVIIGIGEITSKIIRKSQQRSSLVK